MEKLQQYLDCQDDQVLDVYDSLIDSILQNQNEQEKLVLYLKDYMQLVEIKKKIRILQLINEVICCNDQNFKQLIQIHFLEMLKEYYEHQSKTVQSNYLCQEDEIEVIELYMFVNKIIGYFELQQTENLRLSIKKTRQESIKPQFESRASIVLDEFEKNIEDKECQTEEDEELLRWKNKWELQFNYNQRLQNINQQLRNQITELQKKQSTSQKTSSLIVTSQNTFNKEILLASFGQSQSQQLTKFEHFKEDEEDVIVIQENNQVPTQSPSVSSILKKAENDKKQKKKVQFLQRRIPIQCYNYENLFCESDRVQLQNLKKCSFSKYGIVFDDRQIQILMQVSEQQEFETTLTILNRTNEDVKLSFLYKQPVNVNQRIKDLILNSKKVQKQIIYNDKDELIQLQIHYEIGQQIQDKLILIPNFLNKYLQYNKLTQQMYEKHLDEIRNQDTHTLLELKLQNFNIDEDNVFKVFPNYFKDNQKNNYISSINYKKNQFYCKAKQLQNELLLKLLIDRENEKFGGRLLQQFAFLFVIQKK